MLGNDSFRALIVGGLGQLTSLIARDLEHLGMRVAHAPSGMEGLGFAEREPPDLTVIVEPLPDLRTSELRALLRSEFPVRASGVVVVGFQAGTSGRRTLLIEESEDRLKPLLHEIYRAFLAAQHEPPGWLPRQDYESVEIETAAIAGIEPEQEMPTLTLAELGLEHLLYELARNGRTGTLHVGSFEASFLEGRPIDASLAGRVGVGAFVLLFRSLSLEAGGAIHPRFLRRPAADIKTQRRTIDADLTSILAKSHDLEALG